MDSGLKQVIETAYKDSLPFMKRVYDGKGLGEVGSLDFNNYSDDPDYKILFFFDYHEFFGIKLTPENDKYSLSPLTMVNGFNTEAKTTEEERAEYKTIINWVKKIRLNPVP